MTMPVDQRFRLLTLEVQLPAALLLLANDELFKKESRLSHSGNGMALYEVRILVSKCQHAAGLAADDGISPLHVGMELSNIEGGVGSGIFRQPLRNHWTPAALTLRQFH